MSGHEHPAVARLRERVREAAARSRPLHIRAGGTKDFYGNPTRGEPLDPRDYSGIVDYAPTELVVTARGGTPLGARSRLREPERLLQHPHGSHGSRRP